MSDELLRIEVDADEDGLVRYWPVYATGRGESSEPYRDRAKALGDVARFHPDVEIVEVD